MYQYQQGHLAGFDFIALIPLVILMVPLAIGFTLLAGRMGRSQFLWGILSVIPFVNYFFWIYAMFVTLLYMLDKLNAISARAGAQTPGG